MVDRVARDKAAELLRQLASYRMTWDEYQCRYDALTASRHDRIFRDTNAEALYVKMVTLKTLGSRRRERQTRRELARWVLFLQSDAEYLYRESLWDGSVWLIVTLFTLIALTLPEAIWMKALILAPLWYGYVRFERWISRRKARKFTGERSVWPFYRPEELEVAKRQPRLLYGRRQNEN